MWTLPDDELLFTAWQLRLGGVPVDVLTEATLCTTCC